MKQCLQNNLFKAQGIDIDLLSDERLSSYISYFVKILFKGENVLKTEPLKLELYITENPPPLPDDAIKEIKGPSITYYYNENRNVYFVLNNGSYVILDPIMKKAQGYLKKDILNNSTDLFPLIGAPVIEMLKYNGLFLWHAAALNGNGLSFLVSGDGGCGKTTTSLSLVKEGFQYVSDDSVFLQEHDNEISVSPLYKSFHVDQNLSDRFPDILGHLNLEIPNETKVAVNMSEVLPGSFTPSLKPDIIIFPKIVPSEKSSLHSISQMDVYGRLLKQTILAIDKDISRNQLRILEKLVKQTRGFELSGGRDIYNDPKKLVNLLSRVIC